MRATRWLALLILLDLPSSAATSAPIAQPRSANEQSPPMGLSRQFRAGPNGTLVRQVLASPRPGEVHEILGTSSSLPASDPWVWLDSRVGVIADFVAITGDGLHAIAGWDLNLAQAAVYRTTRDPLEFVQDLPSGGWWVPVDADEHGEHLLATSAGDSLYVLSSTARGAVASHGYPAGEQAWWCATASDGSTLAAASRGPGGLASIQVFGASNELRFTRTIHASYPLGVAVSADGSVVAANGYDVVEAWDAHTGALLDSIGVPEAINSSAPVVLSGDGRRLAIGTLGGAQVRVYQWDGARYAPLWSHAMEGATWVTALAISRDGRTLAAGTVTLGLPETGSVALWEAERAQPSWQVPTNGGGCFSIALAADGSTLAAGTWADWSSQSGNIVQIWDRDSAVPIWHACFDPSQALGSCQSVDVSSDGGVVMASGKANHAEDFGNSGWVMAIQTPGRPVQIGFTVSPAVLGGKSRGRWITAWLQPPRPFTAARILISSIRLNGTLGVDPAAAWELGDANQDGIQDLQVKFAREAVEAMLAESRGLALHVTGWMRDRTFEGDDSIKVAGRTARRDSNTPPTSPLEVRCDSPARVGAIQLVIHLPSEQPAFVDVFDIMGRVVLAERLGPVASGAHALRLPDLRLPGLYWVRLRQGNEAATARMVLLR